MHSRYINKGHLKIFELSTYAQQEYNFSKNGFKVGDKFTVKSMNHSKWRTAMPNYLSEPELIDKMQKNGIGTDGTIPKHIEKIVFRNYVKVHRDHIRYFIPTGLGIGLARGFQKVDPQLIEPIVRSYIESASKKISNCEMKYDTVITHVLDKFRRKLIIFIADFHKVFSEIVKIKEIEEEVKVTEGEYKKRSGNQLKGSERLLEAEEQGFGFEEVKESYN